MSMVRSASAADAPALARMRAAFSDELSGALFTPEHDAGWQATFRDVIANELAAQRMLILVVDADDGLAACGVATIAQWLPAPHLADGRIGHILNVYTDPAHRRRGYSRAIVERLLHWFTERGVVRVDLHASAASESLYRSLGFTDHPDPSLSWRLPADRGSKTARR